MLIDDLPTPCVLVERNRLRRNVAQMQERAEANGVALRPHTKTHKSIAVARMQAEAGARGLTTARVGEAEVYVDAGFDDVRLAYTVVGDDKYERLLALMDRARVSFCVDTMEGARAASAFFAARGRTAEVLVEVDPGYGRCGVPWDDPAAPAFVRAVEALPGLRLVGLLTHAGQAYYGPVGEETEDAALRHAAADERDRMLELAARLREAGVEAAAPGRLELSIGSTPTMSRFENREHEGFRITEIRPGNYVYYDAMQVALGAAALDACALTVYTSVVSRRREGGQERLFLDAGKKVLTSDTGYGTDGHGVLLYNARTMQPLPHARITGLSEEHGWVRVTGGAVMDVGDRVRLVPNHACVVVHTQDRLYLVDGESVVEELKVDARGA